MATGERSFVVTLRNASQAGLDAALASWMRENLADGLLLDLEDVQVVESGAPDAPAGDPLWDRYLDGDR